MCMRTLIAARGGVQLRLGIDVGGTNTDAVLLRNTTVVGSAKAPTTTCLLSGIKQAVTDLLSATAIGALCCHSLISSYVQPNSGRGGGQPLQDEAVHGPRHHVLPSAGSQYQPLCPATEHFCTAIQTQAPSPCPAWGQPTSSMPSSGAGASSGWRCCAYVALPQSPCRRSVTCHPSFVRLLGPPTTSYPV